MKKPVGLLIILAGPSGVGKGTVRAEVFKNKKLNLAFSVSLTTRKPRKDEKDGRDYFFVSQKQFDKKIKEGDFLEHAEFAGNCYGTSKSYVSSLLKKGKNVVLEIELNGTSQILKQFKKDEVLPIFLLPPSLKELERRLKGRASETPDSIKRRLAKAKQEMKKKNQFKYVVVNSNVKEAATKITKIITSELKKRR